MQLKTAFNQNPNPSLQFNAANRIATQTMKSRINVQQRFAKMRQKTNQKQTKCGRQKGTDKEYDYTDVADRIRGLKKSQITSIPTIEDITFP